MDPKIDRNSILSEEEAENIRKAASEILSQSIPLCNNVALHAVGALLLAAGSAAAYAKLSYKEMIDLISTYYEGALLNEIAAAESPGTLFLAKPPGMN
jgi:hypothetical protein